MTYTCNFCGFIFTRAGPVERCPACDSTRVVADDCPEQLVFGNVILLPTSEAPVYPLRAGGEKA